MFNKVPYTNYHEMNLDWIIEEMKQLIDDWEAFSGTVTADAHTSTDPEVTVNGDLKQGLNFDFGLVQGPRGLTGPVGPTGPTGAAGAGLQILDEYATLADLQTAHPTGSAGDSYLVGSGGTFTLYIWSTDQSAWVDGGALTSPSPSTVAPSMDGTAAVGSSVNYARADHVHPSDTSKLDASSSDGVYAVESGVQTMLAASDSSLADALVQYDSVGDISTRNLTASGDITVSGDASISGDLQADDIAASGAISGDSISITNDTVLNSDKLKEIVNKGNAGQALLTVNPIAPLYNGIADLSDPSPIISFTAQSVDGSGTSNAINNKVYFSTSFYNNDSDYSERRIDLKPATANLLGGVKAGSGLSIAADGTLSSSANALSIDLLWTNSNPSATFAAQKIIIDLTDYKIIGYYVYRTGSSSYLISGLCMTEASHIIWAGSYATSAQIPLARYMEIDNTGITFGDGYNVTSNSVNNTYMIPYKIFGIK